MNYEAIVLAAGQGKRMNAGMNKQFIELGGEPLIVRTLKVFDRDERCARVVLVVNPAERSRFEQLVVRFRIKKWQRSLRAARSGNIASITGCRR